MKTFLTAITAFTLGVTIHAIAHAIINNTTSIENTLMTDDLESNQPTHFNLIEG